MNASRFTSLIVVAMLLGACSYLPSWMGGGDGEEEKLPGERIDVLPADTAIKPAESLKDDPVVVPDAAAQDAWPQDSGNAAHALSNIAFSGALAPAGETHVGKDNDWEAGVVPNFVVADGKIFAMDAKGYISAHHAGSLGAPVWVSGRGTNADETNILGGGLAYDGGVLYATSGNGKVFALDAADGKKRWEQTLNLPLRSAPLAAYGKLFVLTASNELYALNESDGSTAWVHQGIEETAGFLGLVTPATAEGLVVVPYSSGEIRVLKAESGEEAWTDSLVLPHRTSATAVFTGIDANPVVEDGVVYAVGSSGVLAASNLVSGQRLWEQEISAINTPWVAGNTLYVISTKNELIALKKEDGRVRWVKKLPAKDDDEAIEWYGPVMAGGKLWIFGDHGRAMAVDATNGAIAEFKVADGVMTPPVVVGGVLYVISKDATLHAYK